MKTLNLMRHADAVAAQLGQNDYNRPLSTKGILQAKSKQYLLQQIPVEHIYCSTAKRTLETAAILLENSSIKTHITYAEPLYNCTFNTLLNFILTLPHSIQNVLVIGHNPSLSQVLNHFINDTQLAYLDTSSFISIQFETLDWSMLECAPLSIPFKDFN